MKTTTTPSAMFLFKASVLLLVIGLATDVLSRTAPHQHTPLACGHGAANGVTNKTEFAPIARDQHFLSIEFRDAQTNALLPVRFGVFNASDQIYLVSGLESHVFQSRQGKSYFYSHGFDFVQVESGDVTIRAGHGFEYTPLDTIITVNQSMNLTFHLSQHTDMNALDRYSGDTHVHISHPPIVYALDETHLLLIAQGEDLNFVNSMEEQPFFSGQVEAISEPDHILFFGKEQRNSDFAHLSIVGLEQWINDQGCGGTFAACGATLNSSIYQQVYAQGNRAAVVATHCFSTLDLYDKSPWPGGGVWRGMPMDLVQGTIDAMDILSYTSAFPPLGLDYYFNALSAGFFLPPSAGTDASPGSGSSRPPGGYRVYVDLDGDSFIMDNWIVGLKAGRSFVTNYPLFTDFVLDGAEPGDTLGYSPGAMLGGTVSVTSIQPVDTVTIIGNTGVLTTLVPAGGSSKNFTAPFTIDVTNLTWVVAQATGPATGWHIADENGLYALTAPIYLQETSSAKGPVPERVAGPRQVPTFPCPDAADFFVSMATDVKEIFDIYGIFPNNNKAEFDSLIDSSIEYFNGLCEDAPLPFEMTSPCDAHLGTMPMVPELPTLLWEEAIDADPGDAVTYTLYLDTDPLLSNPSVFTGLTQELFTPAAPLVEGTIYYWHVDAEDQTGRVTGATTTPCAFEVMTIASGIDPPSVPDAWAILGASPNPFNPSVSITYHVPSGGGRITLAVFNASGRFVRSLVRETRPSGTFVASWNGRSDSGDAVASGVYFVRLTPARALPIVRKVVLLK